MARFSSFVASHRLTCVLAAMLMSAGCQSAPQAGLDARLSQIQNERLAQIRQEQAQSMPPTTAPDEGWLSTDAPPQRQSGESAAFALAAYQTDLDTPSDAGDSGRRRRVLARGPLPSFRDTLRRDIKNLPGDLWHQTVDVYTNPLNLIILAGAGGASIAVAQHQDEDTAEFFEEHHHFGQGWRDALSFAGNPATHFVLAGLWYTVGAVKQDDKTYEVGKTLIDALVINGLSTSLIKIVSNRESPNGEEQAFPSGHTSSSVTFATVMNEAYGPWVGLPLYGLSALVAMERLDDGEHWISDVVFGAALGLVVGQTVAGGRPPEIFGGQLAPYVNPENGISGIAWVKTFD